MDDSIQIIEDSRTVDDDDDVIIIDNPHPKSPAPVVILFDSDDDDVNDDDGGGEKLTKENDKNNSSDNPQNTTLDMSKENCLEIISLDNSDGSCIRINDALMNDKNKAMKEWYKKYKSCSSTSLMQGPSYYVCPECLASLPSIFMIDKHIIVRHPKSIHRFHKDNKKGCILHVLSDSESPSPIKHTESSSFNLLTKNCGVATSSENKEHSSAVQRLKLTPLQARGKNTRNCDNPSNKTANSDLYLPLDLPPLPTIHSQDELYTTNVYSTNKVTGLSPLKRNMSETVVSLTNSRASDPPMARIKPLVSTVSSKISSESFVCPETRKPLTVVLFSPNDSAISERKVHVSPRDSDSKIEECFEIISTDDNSELEDSVQENSIEDIRTQRVVELDLKKNKSVPLKNGFKKAISKKINSRINERKNLRTSSLKRGKDIVVDKNSNSDDCKDKPLSKDESSDVGTAIPKEAAMRSSGKIVSKKRKRDPLLILTEGDSPEKSIPEKRLKGDDPKSQIKDVPKKFLCEHCNKRRFTTLNDKANHIRDKHLRPKDKNTVAMRRSPPLYVSTDPPPINKLSTMKHIVMIDVDNWRKIFESDLKFSPSTFVWAFHGGATTWCPPVSSALLRHLQELDCFYLHPKCGMSKDAADFALCVQAGKLDVQLPKAIPFTVLSGDKGFRELQNQLKLSKREVHIVNPHHKTLDTVLSILNSIADK